MTTLRLNPLSGTPLYLQLVEHLKHSIETGAVRAGEQLPSVRKMAEDLLINPTLSFAPIETWRAKGFSSCGMVPACSSASRSQLASTS